MKEMLCHFFLILFIGFHLSLHIVYKINVIYNYNKKIKVYFKGEKGEVSFLG